MIVGLVILACILYSLGGMLLLELLKGDIQEQRKYNKISKTNSRFIKLSIFIIWPVFVLLIAGNCIYKSIMED
jgi:hypothetical protein